MTIWQGTILAVVEMPSITDILVHYPILCSVTRNLTTLDLLHLASSSRMTAAIFKLTQATFDHLKRYTLCDGSGALARSVWNCCLLDSAYERSGNITRDVLIALIRAPVDDISCWRIFLGNYRSMQERCLQVDVRPCSRCKIMVCQVSVHGAFIISSGQPIGQKGCRQINHFKSHMTDETKLSEYITDTHTARLRCLCQGCVDLVDLQPRERIHRCSCMATDRWICLRCCAKDNLEDARRWHVNPDRAPVVSVPLIAATTSLAEACLVTEQTLCVHCLRGGG